MDAEGAQQTSDSSASRMFHSAAAVDLPLMGHSFSTATVPQHKKADKNSLFCLFFLNSVLTKISKCQE